MTAPTGIPAPARRNALIAAILLLGILQGCATSSGYRSGEQHVVRRGETLAAIAWRYGHDYRDLARWNQLGDGSLIFPGQVIRLTPPSGRQSAASRRAPSARPLPAIREDPSPEWAWPTRGRVRVAFGGRPGSGTGVLLGGDAGQEIRAAAGGRVVYSGSGLIGYGQLIIIKHNDTYLSAYGYNQTLLVKEGDTVRQGQRIATMGEGPGREPRLHFEIRRNGKPVNPLSLLPGT